MKAKAEISPSDGRTNKADGVLHFAQFFVGDTLMRKCLSGDIPGLESYSAGFDYGLCFVGRARMISITV